MFVEAISKLGLDIDTRGLVKGSVEMRHFQRESDQAARAATRLEQAQKRQAERMSAMAGMAGNLAAQLAAAFSVAAIIRAGDAWTSATNQLRLVTESARELRDITQEVFDLSQRTASRFEATSGLYASIQRAAGQAIGSQREVLRLTETIMKLASASGGPEGSRNAALFQLRQAMQGVTLQAQEYNSLVDGAPLLVQALADSLGVTRGQLRAMVLDQQVQITQLISGLQGYADEADALFARVNFTVGDAMTRLGNAFQQLVGTSLGPVFSALVNGITALSENLGALIPILSGVAVAFAIAFAPTAVEAMTFAVGALFTLIAKHPFAIIAGAIVAAALAINQFGDEVIVATVAMKGFAKIADDESSKAGKALSENIDVSLKNVIDESLAQFWSAIQQIGADISTLLPKSFDDTADAADTSGADIQATFTGVANWIIGALRTVYDYAKMIFPQLMDFIVLAIGRAGEYITDKLLAPLNAAREVMGMQPVQISTFQELDALQQRIVDRSERFNADMARNFSEDYVGNIMRGAAARAAADREGAEAAQEQAAAAAAAAGATDALTKKIEEQAAARAAMFADLEAQVNLGEREYQQYEQTEQLLKKFPEYYAAMAAGAEDVAGAARAAAEEDAKRLLTLQRQAAIVQQQRQLLRDNSNARRLAEAAAISADEYELTRRTFDLMERNAELYDHLEAGAESRARAEAATQIALERQTEELVRQAERARDLSRAPALNLMQGLEEAGDDFWTNFVDKGFGAFDDLGDQLKNVFRQLQADILRATFEPILANIRGAVTQSVSGMSFGGGGGANFGSILGQIFGGNASSNTVAGLGNVRGTPLATPQTQAGAAQSSGFLSSIFGANGLGSLFGKGSAIGQLGGLLGRAFSPASTIGSALAGLVGLGDGKYSGIGGMIGGIAGSFLGPIGSAIGSFIGSALGKLLGGKESNHAATLGITKGGDINPTYDEKAVAETIQAVEAAAGRITEGQGLLKDMGATLNTWISGLQLGQRDQSWFSTNGKTAEQGVRTGSVGDPEDLAMDALNAVLKDAVFDVPILNTVKDAMIGANRSFEDTIKVLGTLKDILPNTNEALSEWQQARKNLDQAFNDIITEVGGIATAAGKAVRDQLKIARQQLQDEFSSGIADTILGIKSPLQKQFADLLESQAQRIEDAGALGIKPGSRRYADVLELNGLELKSFIENAAGSADAFADLNKVFDELIAKAQAAGQATGPLIEAFNQARDGIRGAFDDSVGDQLAELSNPTLFALKQLLDAQKARLAQARDLGANIIAVERLNAAEQRAFFDGLSDEQRQALASHLGLIEDFTGRIALVLSQLGDELAQRIDDMDALRDDLLKRSDAMRDLAENIGVMRQDLSDRYGAQTPKAQVESLRDRLGDLIGDARAGNESALQALPQVAQQLIDQSRSLYGSTTTFRNDYDLVQNLLAEAEALAGGRADALASEAETLVEQRDLLIEIRDILNQPDPALDALAERLAELDLGNQIVADLLAQYLDLQASENGQTLDMAALYAQAAGVAQTPASNTAEPGAKAAQVQPQATTVTSADHTADMIAIQVDVLKEGFDDMVEEQKKLVTEFKNLRQTLANAAA